MTNISDGTGETLVTKMDASALTHMSEDATKKVSKIWYSVNTTNGKSGVELLCFPETHLSGYRVGLLDADATFSPQVLENALCEVSEK